MEAAKLKLDESDLGGAIAAAIESVKKKPTDIATRTFLFELSCSPVVLVRESKIARIATQLIPGFNVIDSL